MVVGQLEPRDKEQPVLVAGPCRFRVELVEVRTPVVHPNAASAHVAAQGVVGDSISTG